MKHPLASLFAGRVLSRAVASATLVGLATAAPGVYAQETSAAVRGAVSTSSGEALAGATVIVTSNATGVSKPRPPMRAVFTPFAVYRQVSHMTSSLTPTVGRKPPRLPCLWRWVSLR